MEKKGFFILALILVFSFSFVIVSAPFGYDNPTLPQLREELFGDKPPGYYMPNNKSVFGNFSFNGGWEGGGFSIIDGDIYAQTGYFYNLSSLNITKANLTILDYLNVEGNVTADNFFGEFGDLVSEQNPDGADAIRLKGTASDVDVVIGDVTGYFSVYNVADNNAVFYVNNLGDTDIAGDLTVDGTIINTDFTTLTDNSMADTLHRHSELSASDGTPDQAVVVDATGQVGINKATPLELLQVGGGLPSGSEADQFLAFQNSFLNANNNGIRYYLVDGTTLRGYMYWDTAENLNLKGDEIRFDVLNTNDAVVIDEAGKVGIGKDSPDSIFHIKANVPGGVGSASAGQIIIQNPADDNTSNAIITGYESDGSGNPDQQLWYLGSSSTGNEDITFLNRRDAKLNLGTNGNSRITILGNGNVGIGVSDPHSKLEVAGAISSATMIVTASADNTSVSGVNTMFVNIASNIVLGGLTDGVNGQILNIVYIGNYANTLTIEDTEGVGDQDFYTHTRLDETIDGGGHIFICDGSNWYDASHAKHV